MFQYRQVLVRLHAGDSVREIARAQARPTSASSFRTVFFDAPVMRQAALMPIPSDSADRMRVRS